MKPRIYTYKITFEEVPYYYYGVKKEKYYNQEYWGSPKANKWCWEWYTPKKQILEFFDYSDEGWLKAQEIEKQLIKPFFNIDKWCLNANCGGKISLNSLRKFATGRKHQCGEKNSQYGKNWITNGEISRLIPKTDPIPLGYTLGRTVSVKRVKLQLSPPNTRQRKCHSKLNTPRKCKRKFEVSKEELINLIKQYPMTKVGRILGVSDNAVRKRCKSLGISYHNKFSNKVNRNI